MDFSPPIIDLEEVSDTSLTRSRTEQEPVKRRKKVEKEPVFVQPRTSSRRSSSKFANMKGREITVVPETPMPKQQVEPTRFFNKKTEKTFSEKKMKATEKPVVPDKKKTNDPPTPQDTSTTSYTSERRQSKRCKKVSTKFTSDQYVLNKPVNIFAEPPVEPKKKEGAELSLCSRTKPSPSEAVEGTKRRSERQSGSRKVETVPDIKQVPSASKRRSSNRKTASVTSDSEVEAEKTTKQTKEKTSSVAAPIPPKRRSRQSARQDTSVAEKTKEQLVMAPTEKKQSPEKENVLMCPPSSASTSRDNKSTPSMGPPSTAPPRRKEKKLSENDSLGPLVSVSAKKKKEPRCSLAEFDLGGVRKGAKEELNKSKKVSILFLFG